MREANNKIKGSIKENVSLMKTPLMSILPGQISFFIILSIIPLASIFVMLISKLSINIDAITNIINHYIPEGVANVILSILNNQKAGVVDILFILTALYLAAKATHSIIIASTQIYNGKQENFIRTRIKAIIMLIILLFVVITGIGILFFGSKLIMYIKSINGDINQILYWAYTILKWPFVFFVTFFSVKIIYTIAPNVKIPSSSVNKGALFTTSISMVTTVVYSFYITHFANFSKFYGSLSNIIILMMWIYWISYIFVYGMTINEYKLNSKNNKSLD